MRSRSLLLALALVGVTFAACDPTRSDAVTALGDEQNGVHEGPTHRPGQPCLLCHDGAFGDPTPFSVAGTVFETAGSTRGASGADVRLTDVTGTTYVARTNDVGNFYVSPSAFTPHYPMTAEITSGSTTVVMQTLISRDGSCAGCHVDPIGPGSPGRVALTSADGGTPP